MEDLIPVHPICWIHKKCKNYAKIINIFFLFTANLMRISNMLILYGYEKIDFDSFFPRPRLYYDDPGGCILS